MEDIFQNALLSAPSLLRHSRAFAAIETADCRKTVPWLRASAANRMALFTGALDKGRGRMICAPSACIAKLSCGQHFCCPLLRPKGEGREWAQGLDIFISLNREKICFFADKVALLFKKGRPFALL